MVKHDTIQRVATPTALLVALPDGIARSCTEALDEGGLRVLRVGHAAAASERIPVIMPQLVVVGAAVGKDELELLADRCVAVGAEVLRLAPDEAPVALMARLKAAATTAIIKAMRG